jgi:hypothetical protein
VVEITYCDDNGDEIKVGDRICISGGHEMETPTPFGVIAEIHESTIGVEDDIYPYWVPPILKVLYDDGDEDEFSAAGWYGGEKFVFEEITKCALDKQS